MYILNFLLVVNIVFLPFHGTKILHRLIYHIHTYQFSKNTIAAGDSNGRFSLGTITAEGASAIVLIGA